MNFEKNLKTHKKQKNPRKPIKNKKTKKKNKKSFFFKKLKQIKKDIRQQERKMTEITRPQIITPEMLTTDEIDPLTTDAIVPLSNSSFSSRCPYEQSVHLECNSELNERALSIIWEYNQLYNNWSLPDTTYYEHLKKTILLLHYLQDDLNNDNVLFPISYEKNPTIVESDGGCWELYNLVVGMSNFSEDDRAAEQGEYRHDDTDPELLAEKNEEIDLLLNNIKYLSNLGFCCFRT